MKDNRGFSLTELMIVISIVGFLATVTVPSTIGLRDSVKEQHVISNISMVRGYLETHALTRKIDNNSEVNSLVAGLEELERNELSSEYSLKNPFTKGTNIESGAAASLRDNVSLVVYASNGYYDGEFDGGIDEGNDDSKGKIYIKIYDNAYVVWGRDSDGESIFCQVVQ